MDRILHWNYNCNCNCNCIALGCAVRMHGRTGTWHGMVDLLKWTGAWNCCPGLDVWKQGMELFIPFSFCGSRTVLVEAEILNPTSQAKGGSQRAESGFVYEKLVGVVRLNHHLPSRGSVFESERKAMWKLHSTVAIKYGTGRWRIQRYCSTYRYGSTVPGLKRLCSILADVCARTHNFFDNFLAFRPSKRKMRINKLHANLT
ncbi:hypothetical protein B0T20DRAFT_488075 [Sordaria brevicollis]|uniref:Uncharacterized protein n=1 Tax=Sordaria brevicollis TaxID=83679 RepID=A0AAE0P308_SORBR|nr:hypothetical protein B0T20DRAFT_488075 [Sordaria brevicollis]